MEKVAKFEKISCEQFGKDLGILFPNIPEMKAKEIYDSISLPKRATSGSAGYDLFLPFGVFLKPHESITVPTGIRAHIAEGWVLNIYPRSGLGFKFRLRLDNTVGIIDSDYYYSENEGHIMIKFTNEGENALCTRRVPALRHNRGRRRFRCQERRFRKYRVKNGKNITKN